MVDVKQTNAKWAETINLKLAALDKFQGQTGWFENFKYEDGTPVAYVAAINEYGVPERSLPARPFMRPTASKKKTEWAETAATLSKRMVDGTLQPRDVYDLLGAKAATDIVKTIDSITAPPLSPITLGARKYRSEGKEVTGATIGEIARKIKDGTLDVSGVPNKPLIDTNLMRNSIENIVEEV